MVRSLLIAAALSAASTVAVVPAASAQTYGGITLSFGSGGYSYDSDYSTYDPYAGYYYNRQPNTYYYYAQQPSYDYYDYYANNNWAARERLEQQERWRRDQAQRHNWYGSNDHGYGEEDEDEDE